MADIEAQVERVLREMDHLPRMNAGNRERIMYVRHHDEFDQVFYICTECEVKGLPRTGVGEHEEVVAKGEKPKLECPYA